MEMGRTKEAERKSAAVGSVADSADFLWMDR